MPERLPAVVDRVGAIVEQPKFFPAFTARRNLELLAAGIGAPQGPGRPGARRGRPRRTAARDRFRSYSLGMKQRLAIAGTLLKDPELLIFDEPTNGLDPAGIHEIRETMRGLADAGRTVLVSSHILSEVQQVADTVTIIGRGRLLAEGDVDEILARGGTEAVRVRVPDPAAAAQVLLEAGLRARNPARPAPCSSGPRPGAPAGWTPPTSPASSPSGRSTWPSWSGSGPTSRRCS